MGFGNEYTIWALINVETSATGDELVVLRAQKSIGALPRLDRNKVLELEGRRAIELVEKLEEEIFSAGPESVVDRAREASAAILSAYLQSTNKAQPGLDLANLAERAADEKLDIVANSARTIARLHARGKNAEQEIRASRKVTEQDAEFSVRTLNLSY